MNTVIWVLLVARSFAIDGYTSKEQCEVAGKQQTQWVAVCVPRPVGGRVVMGSNQ
jgi:hypothetical protein